MLNRKSCMIIYFLVMLLMLSGCVKYYPVEYQENRVENTIVGYLFGEELRDGKDYSKYGHHEAKTAEQVVKIADRVFRGELGLREYLCMYRPYVVTYYEKEKLWAVGEDAEQVNCPETTWSILIRAENGEILCMWLE